MTGALCRQARPADADNWYPEKGQNCVVTARKAKQTCDLCPVKQRCLDFALAYDEQWGIWGGVNLGQTRQRDRQQMRDQRGVTILAKPERTDVFLLCVGDRRRNRQRKDTA